MPRERASGSCERILRRGPGWRLGWDPHAERYLGLIGTDDWAIELTEPELDDFCRLLAELDETIRQLANVLMDAEQVTCELESELLWLEAEGYPHAYTLRAIFTGDRRCEGSWTAASIPGLVHAVRGLHVF
ncbi:protein containing domain of unknown function (DUF1818) [Rubidibacter lacunae KORDI 51-2]|uniref:DUF1818 domain-containing protein n=1 Tax=Rubidibacter lacunae KORDI 51-2 TaxID=582515 RepID=U5DIG6_9CHRO|nr:DUF1818 family protein [Rubidibacter lacunae]ERN40389.1 protein containing domain of unknown function (DUF1818) [Rubidibacter lacunae KORDI 51-2]